jgi:putative ABC transport system substrate-binding protein
MSMDRRSFICLLSGAAWTGLLAAHAQQRTMPVIGFLNFASPDGYGPMMAAFLQGLRESGYVEGENVAIEYRWAKARGDRLPAMVADLVHRQVVVIAATSTPAALAAKAATANIPIVFETGFDPIMLGLVLHQLLPKARVMALLVNPSNAIIAGTDTTGARLEAANFGVELLVLHASIEHEFDALFSNLMRLGAAGLVIGSDPLFTSRIEMLGALAAHHAVPAVLGTRGFVAAGGLVGYGGSFIDSYRLAGVYTGRILKGEKPGELPVQQGTKFEMFLNLKTAKALGIEVPASLLARADEVIE